MKKSFMNRYLKVFLGFAAFAPIATISLTYSTHKESNFISLINSNHKSLTYGWQTNNNSSTTSYSTPSHMKKNQNNIEYDLDSIQQDLVYDDAFTSYASIGSSSNTSFNNDLISKFWLSSVAQSKTTNGQVTNTVSVPGTKQWTVKKSDLANLINVTNDNETKIESILYSGGGELVSKALFVILHSTNTTTPGSFLFQIKWEDDSKVDLKDKNAGDYRLVRQLSTDATTKFNFMTLEAAATHTINFFELKEYTSSSSSDYTIKAGKITGTANYENDTTTQTTYTITLANDLLNNVTQTSVTYKPIFAYRSNALGNDAYIIYQANSYTNANANKYLFTIRIPQGKDKEVDFTMNNTDYSNSVRNISLTNISNIFKENENVTVTFTPNNGANYMMFFSQENATQTSASYGYLNLNLVDTGSDKTYSATKIENKNGKMTNLYTVSKLYNATSELIGFVFLDKNGQVFQFDNNFQSPIMLYNFKQSTISLGDIYRLVTSPSSASWFAQMSDSTFAQFSGSTFVGQWDKLAANNSYELPLGFSIKSQSEVDPAVISQKVAAGDTTYESSFINYLANGESYKDFLDVTFQDPRLSTSPQVTITQSAFQSSSTKIYSVTLTFKQKLRQINYNGAIVSDQVKEVTLATQTYKFNNAISEVYAADDGSGNIKQPIPVFIKNKLPSQITKDEIKNYLVVLKNVTNETITSTYNDSTGSMRVIVNVPYMWEIGGSGEQLATNKVFAFDYSGYFNSNSLGSSATITEVDDEYLNKEENSNLKTSLLAKYSAKLPSSVDPEELINSFVIFGPAFSQQNNFDSGLISPKDEWITTVIPYDKEGKAKIDITIPNISSSKNVKISFETPSIFLSNPNANSSVYFMFKENKEVMTDELKKQNASTIASKLNSTIGGNNSGVISSLSTFASFSDYFVSYINDGTIKVSAVGDDNYGTLKIVIDVTKDGEKLPGFSSSTIETMYQGFIRSSGSQLVNDNLKFKENIGEVGNISPLNITADSLMTNYNIFEGSASQTINKITISNISLNKSTISGTVQVIVTIYNYVENNTVFPQKSFIHTYTGFKRSQEPVDMIVWKSFYEIGLENQSYRNSRPSDIINSINSTSLSNKEKLNIFANISSDLSSKLRDQDINLILEGDDGTGELTITATVKIDDTSLSLSTIIDCNDNQSLTPIINLVSNNSTNSDLALLRNKRPSEISSEDASKLYSFANANSYVKEVNLVPDDAKGTLNLTVKLLTTTGSEILSSTSLYTQFVKYVPINNGTNWGIVAAAVIVPLVVLLIPIIVLGVVQDLRNKKRIAKKLDNRLNEEYKKNFNKKY